MINERKVKRFCKDYTKIENYEEAVDDQSQVWHCHHILGEILSREQLKDHDFYYNVPPCMLKFVTRAEHNRLHNTGKHPSAETLRKKSEAMKGHAVSEETRRKISEALKGKSKMKGDKNPMYGRHHSEETRRKISESKKGKPGHKRSEETRMKISEAMKGEKNPFYGKKGKLTWKLINGKRAWIFNGV